MHSQPVKVLNVVTSHLYTCSIALGSHFNILNIKCGQVVVHCVAVGGIAMNSTFGAVLCNEWYAKVFTFRAKNSMVWYLPFHGIVNMV